MRQSYEPLLYKYGVDVSFLGHVHGYERTNPVYNYTVDECGPVHITIGKDHCKPLEQPRHSVFSSR